MSSHEDLTTTYVEAARTIAGGTNGAAETDGARLAPTPARPREEDGQQSRRA